MDVHITKDKKVVVIHDATINRTSNGKGFVHLKTLHYLKKFNYGFGKQKEGAENCGIDPNCTWVDSLNSCKPKDDMRDTTITSEPFNIMVKP